MVFLLLNKVTYLMTTKGAKKNTKAHKRNIIYVVSSNTYSLQQACGLCCPLFSTVLTSRYHLFHKTIL